MYWQVTGITNDFSKVKPGNLFVAEMHPDNDYDGHMFVEWAVEKGANTIVAEIDVPGLSELARTKAQELQNEEYAKAAIEVRHAHLLAGTFSARTLSLRPLHRACIA